MERENLEYTESETTSEIERPKSYALIWSLALAFVPTTIVVILLSLLLFPDASGEGWLAAYTVAMLVAGNGLLIVVLCSLCGIVMAIIGWFRTHSHFAWPAIALNLIVPLAIPAVFRLDYHLERQRNRSWVTHDMHKAASEGDLETVRKLDNKEDANVNRMLYGYAPLHKAVAAGKLDMVEYLLQNDANTNASHRGFEAPLHVLAASDWCPCEQEPCNCTRMLEALIKHGADIDRKCNAFRTDITNPVSLPKIGEWTPLLIAMEVNNSTQIKHLVKHGADLTGKADSAPALTVAVRLGRIDTVRFLIANGADVNLGGNMDYPPLMAAASQANRPMMELLLSFGADPNATDRRGQTLLHSAFHASDCNELAEGIKFLLAIGMDIEAQDEYGQTPLHLAVKNRCQDTAKLLLTHGAGLNTRTKDGQTPLHYATRTYARKSIRTLLNAGADVNARTPGGLTPLHNAVSRRINAKEGHIQREVVEMLFQHGAEVNVRSQSRIRKTPIDLVRSWRVTNDKERLQQEQMIELLQKCSQNSRKTP